MPHYNDEQQRNIVLINKLYGYLWDKSNGMSEFERAVLAEKINMFTEANDRSDTLPQYMREDLECRIKRELSRLYRAGLKPDEQREKEKAEREREEKERLFREEQERLKEQERLRRERIEEKKRLMREREQRRIAPELRAAKEAEERERHIEQVTSMDLPLDWSNAFDTDERTQGVHTDSVSDALVLSLNALGGVDIEYISSVTGKSCAEVIGALRGSIYQDPESWGECFYKGWQMSEEYLSGNLFRKLHTAIQANDKYKGYFSDNVEALKKLLPPSASSKDIYVTLGSPWLPTDIVDDFIEHLFGTVPRKTSRRFSFDELAVKHDELTGTWEIPHKMRYANRVRVTQTWGTTDLGGLYILEDTLNMAQVKVTKETYCPTNKSGVKRVIDREATLAALEKQRKMVKEFARWVWLDPARSQRLIEIFEERFGCVRRRVFDGSFLELPGLSDTVSLYPYQKDAVARIIFSPNTLLAHDVGAGKTYEMIAAGQELRRMGLSEKNMYVVPNNIVGQWKSIFLEMYPGASLLCVEPKSFKPDKRAEMLRRMRDESFDGIIIAYSCFEMIPVSTEYLEEEIDEKREAIGESLLSESRSVKGLSKKNENLSKQKEKLRERKEPELICFDKLGVTRLFVDEAHNFKNVPIDTKTGNMPGISRAGSKKCQDMLTKVHIVQKRNSGGGVIFATGTPITNSITDAFIMQKYLQDGELALLDLGSFDGWVGMFAEKTTEFEIDVDTSSYRLATRFTKFHNLPELTSLLASIADFHSVEGSEDIPSVSGRIDIVTEKSPELADYLLRISERADDVRRGTVSRTDDNLLKITTDGRKAALDIRLVDPGAGFSKGCKTAKCAACAADIYFRYSEQRLTQLIFCDISTPKAGFNVYDELRSQLVYYSVQSQDIAYIHDADSEKKRETLFKRVREGEVRILIGSTFKLGLGVNIQDRLIAVHHIDVPWRPADMTQREGRILRRGNMNAEVYIYRYITEGSFDAYSWQLLETKQRFINDLLSGSVVQRSGSDIKDTALDYAEVKALAVGDPLLKERVQAANELSRYLLLQKSYVESRLALERELSELPARRAQFIDNLESSEEDTEAYANWKHAHPGPADNAAKNAEAERRKLLRERLGKALADNEYSPEETVLMNYRGFDVVLPANMSREHPYIWLRRAGKHYVEMGEKDVGNLVRIDNYLERLEEHCGKLREGIARLDQRRAEIETELERSEDYSEKIERYTKRVEKLDKKLGVDKK